MTEETQALWDLLHNDVPWTWDSAQNSAFASVKERRKKPVLTEASLTVSADAPSYDLGAVLLQEDPQGNLLRTHHAP